jgi:uncharacterized protein YbaR (Trm112 family)
VPVPPELMAILQCPVCQGHLEERGDELVCTDCRRRYPVHDGVPHMIVEETTSEESSE